MRFIIEIYVFIFLRIIILQLGKKLYDCKIKVKNLHKLNVVFKDVFEKLSTSKNIYY